MIDFRPWLHRLAALRAQLAVVAVCTLSLINAFPYFTFVTKQATESRRVLPGTSEATSQDFDPLFGYPLADEISLWDKRFAELKGTLPVDRSIGYLSDLPPRDANGSDLTYFKHFFLTLYALAPCNFDLSDERPLVLGNFQSSHIGKRIASERHLKILQDLGNGVMLLKREAGR
ncbi:MAG TPA: hypothetical protein V6D08_09840 [Candidatus Obscuribacterales bacterium]